ncbi:MAG: hypothetical protein DI626_10915 [Micavibrio aeruginosavorus]|uniref:Uncharacterized protein n=1 Tax=Micavibrio aeruginosavorus TaxID=349221 RepID=A0A2W4ZJ54_9BACT|nr:MAG: hypothetical protein DI626_10915 [Micavibrio aeruginosavorus]
MDAISNQKNALNTALSQLKGTKTDASVPSVTMTDAEKRLTEILDISPAAQEKLLAARKVNAHLSFFNAAVKWINGGKKLPDISSYFATPAKTTAKTDIKA